jgi:hypothetical protein
MPCSPKECREHARRCMTRAEVTLDPVVKESLLETAEQWERLAANLDDSRLARRNQRTVLPRTH